MDTPSNIKEYIIQKKIYDIDRCTIFNAKKQSGQKVAIKCVPLHIFHLNSKEVDIMKMLSHPNIIKIIDSFPYPEENPAFQAIVMQSALFDLFDYLYYTEFLEESVICKIMKDILEALRHMHSLQIWHLDLKLENLYVIEETLQGFPYVVIGDFGCSEIYNCEKFKGAPKGSIDYAAPELLQLNSNGLSFKEEAEYSNKVDVWSMGVILYNLFTKKNPFGPKNKGYDRLFKGEVLFNLSENFEDVSIQAKNLIRHMLCSNPDQRYSVQQVLDDPWFQMFNNDRNQALEMDPELASALKELGGDESNL